MIYPHARRPLGLLLIALLALPLLPGCRQRGSGGSDEVQVRLINAVPDADGLDVAVDGQRVWKGTSFRSSTGYQGIAAGAYAVRVGAEGFGGALLANRPIAFEKGRAYTVLALGLTRDAGTPAQVQVLTDDAPALPADKTGLRLINAAPESASLDLVINNIVGLEAVRFGRRSPFLLLDPGRYDLKVAKAGTGSSLAGPTSLSLEAGRTYTVVAMGSTDAQPMSLEAYPDGRGR